MSAQNREDAIAAAERAAEEDPTDYGRLDQLGWAYFFARRYDDAIVAFQRTIDLCADDARGYQGIGRSYLDDGQVDKALEALQRAMDLDPAYVEPHVSLGSLYSWRLGDYEAALDAFQRALAVDPEHPFARAQLGWTYACMGRMDEAASTLAETVRRQPHNQRALEVLCTVYLAMHRYDDLIATCRHYIGVYEDDDAPHRMLGYALSRLGRHEEAIAELERAMALVPKVYEIRGALARVLRAVGRHEEADRHYALAAQMAAADDEFGQASFAAVTGDTDRAVALLEVALAEGQTLLGWVRVDPDLELLRDDPRVKALIDAKV
jgi:tetratricopeptide (TPR) repeat protein